MRRIANLVLLASIGCGGEADHAERGRVSRAPAPTAGSEETPTEPSVTPDAPRAAQVRRVPVAVRVIHAAVQHPQPFDVYLGEETDEASGRPSTIQVASASFLNVGTTRRAEAMSAADASDGVRLACSADGWSDMIAVTDEARRFTLVVYSGSEEEPGTRGRVAIDGVDAPPRGTMRLRFFNALRDEPRVDLCAEGGSRGDPSALVLAAVTHGQFGDGESSAYVDVPHATRLEVRRAGARHVSPCEGPVILPLGVESGGISLDGVAATVIAAGQREGRRMVARALVCMDSGHSLCVEARTTRQ